jgi:hypothetical protein
VFTCPAPAATEFRKQQQAILWQQLANINTPEKLLTTIKWGLGSLESRDHTPTDEFDPEVAQAQFELSGRSRTACVQLGVETNPE